MIPDCTARLPRPWPRGGRRKACQIQQVRRPQGWAAHASRKNNVWNCGRRLAPLPACGTHWSRSGIAIGLLPSNSDLRQCDAITMHEAHERSLDFDL